MNRKTKKECRAQLRKAVSHLVACWDELRKAESLCGFDIRVDALGNLAFRCQYPDDANDLTTDELNKFLRGEARC